MEDNAGKFYLFDGDEHGASAADWPVPENCTAVYEVIRIIKGVPLFFEDHYERLAASFKALGRSPEIKQDQLRHDIKKLLNLNDTENCNVKLVVYVNENTQKRLLYISKSHYPSEEEIEAGAKTSLLRLERNNPNAKLVNKAYKEAVSMKIKESGCFEVILVDSLGRITEGSKSNAFFVQKNKIYTAPGEFVLKGITRKYVFQACENAGYEVIEQFVHADSVEQSDGVFLSGTSIKVFPVASIDKIVFNSSSNPVVTEVRKEYDRIIEKYIDNNVNKW